MGHSLCHYALDDFRVGTRNKHKLVRHLATVLQRNQPSKSPFNCPVTNGPSANERKGSSCGHDCDFFFSVLRIRRGSSFIKIAYRGTASMWAYSLSGTWHMSREVQLDLSCLVRIPVAKFAGLPYHLEFGVFDVWAGIQGSG